MPKAQTPKKARKTPSKRSLSKPSDNQASKYEAGTIGDILTSCFANVPEEAWDEQPFFSNREMDTLGNKPASKRS